jgi:hypothetical protein
MSQNYHQSPTAIKNVSALAKSLQNINQICAARETHCEYVVRRRRRRRRRTNLAITKGSTTATKTRTATTTAAREP